MSALVHDMSNLDGCINTFTGMKFDLLNPTPEMVRIEDIAKGLAYKPHFSGQSPAFFSVAQHSVMVANACHDWQLKAVALMHDAAEAYIGDMVKPLKIHLPFFNEVEEKIQRAIFEKYGLNYSDLPKIKQYDKAVQLLEFNVFYRAYIPETGFEYWTPEQSRIAFINAFLGLVSIKNSSQ